MNRTIRHWGILFALLATTSGTRAQSSDSTRGAWGFQARLNYGFLIAHRPMLHPLQERHLRSLEFSWLLPTTGAQPWQRSFLFPEKGMHVAVFDLGSRSRLGTGVAVYPFLDFPLFRQRDWVLKFRYGLGLGYVQRVFDPEDNFKNTAVGSRLNGTIHFDLHVCKNVGRRGALDAGIGVTHYSNGATAMPNLGINLAGAHFGYRRYFGEKKALTRLTAPTTKGKGYLTAFLSGAWKEIYPPLGKTYFAATISGDYFLPLTTNVEAALGADAFYDPSLRVRMEAAEDQPQPASTSFRPGLHTGIQLRLSHIGLVFNLGYYPYTRFREDGNYFHRIGLRYYFDRVLLCMNLKTHYARADFIEWGVGWRFGQPIKSAT